MIHLELHTGDPAGAIAFYARLCGWRPERIDAGSASYLALGVGDRVGGGVVECPARGSLWLPYVQVGDVAETTERAAELGAEILLAPREGLHGWRSVVSTPSSGEIAFWGRKPGYPSP